MTCPICGKALAGRHGRGHFRREGCWPTLVQRFEFYVRRSAGCWEWSSRHDHDGYAMLRVEPKNMLAHRVAYEAFVGPIPAGMQLDHLCRNRGCVNPSHLEPVTNLENQRRGYKATRSHCPNGHPRTPENVRLEVGPRPGWVKRACRPCQAAAQARMKLRRSEAVG